MTPLKRTIRALAIGLALLVFLAVAGLFALTWTFGKFLEGERVVKGVTVQFYNPDVSMAFALRADSVVIETPAARWTLVHPYAGMDYWGGLTPALAVFGLRADSIAVTVRAVEDTLPDAPLPFPAWLRFPVGVHVAWRTLTVDVPGGATVHAGPAHLETRGAQGVHAALRVAMQGAPPLDARLDVNWRSRVLH